MGKKRRLNAAKAKFRAKHNTHPRMRELLEAASDTVVSPVETIEKEVKVVIAATPVVPNPTLTAEVPETKIATPKAPKTKKTTRKKSTTSTRKRTVKKKTNNTSA